MLHKIIYIQSAIAVTGANMKRPDCIILLFILLLAGGLGFVRTSHATVVGGILSPNTHWTEADSPVLFNGSVTVGVGANLTIDPGVTVVFGVYSLQVYGTLTAQGTPSSQIIFSAAYANNTYYANLGAPIIFASQSSLWNDSAGSGSDNSKRCLQRSIP